MDESNLEIFSDELHFTESRDKDNPTRLYLLSARFFSLSEMNLDDGKGVTSCTLCVESIRLRGCIPGRPLHDGVRRDVEL